MPESTIIVVARERFSCAVVALEGLYRHTAEPFDLVYVDAGSPDYVRRELERLAAVHGFRLVRHDGHLTPNEARNLGLTHARAHEYCVFMDNDVVVEPGWLAALERCAGETGAAIVGPLYLEGPADPPEIHMAGGRLEWSGAGGLRRLDESHGLAFTDYREARGRLQRERCDYVEFHCMLVRRRELERLGGLDEALLCAPEHVDLALAVAAAGGAVYTEPAAVVTYLKYRDYAVSDLPYFRLRWGETRAREGFAHFAAKWDMDPDSPMIVKQLEWMARARRAVDLGREVAGEPQPVTLGPGLPAQTNTQLFNQLQDLGYGADELDLVARCYGSAVTLFAHRFRACGKPFVNHLVGTASLLAAHGAAVPAVATGLLHAAYAGGRFPLPGAAITPEKRAWLRRGSSTAVERVVHLYARMGWDRALVERLDDALDTVSVPAAMVTLVRLANEAEERVDLDLRYTAAPRDRDWYDPLAALGTRLSFAALAEQFQESRRRMAAFTPAPCLVSAHRHSYQVEG